MPATGNLLLDQLPKAEYQLFVPDLVRVDLLQRQVLHNENEPVTRLYFPQRGVLSLVTVVGDGGTVETALVGREGAFGVQGMFGLVPSPWRVVVQVAGEALALDRNVLRTLMSDTPTLHRLLERFSAVKLQFAARSAGCHRFHSLEQRAARWLLTVHDRADSDELHLTQEFLAQMLGGHRPSVTLTLGLLDEAGLIERPGPGLVRILDRPRLEVVACECYRQTRDYAALLAVPLDDNG